jgi:hypothetical protein
MGSKEAIKLSHREVSVGLSFLRAGYIDENLGQYHPITRQQLLVNIKMIAEAFGSSKDEFCPVAVTDT